jgi:hypothetical protein
LISLTHPILASCRAKPARPTHLRGKDRRRGSCRAPAEHRVLKTRSCVSDHLQRKRNVGGSPCIVCTVVKLTGLQPLF